jgi:hypothetical protein
VCLRLVFLLTVQIPAWLRLSRRPPAWKDAGILLLRHQLAVLQRQAAARPRLTWTDRALFAALLTLIPRSRHGALHSFITPGTIPALAPRYRPPPLGRQIQTEEARATTGPPPHRPPSVAHGSRQRALGVSADRRRAGRARHRRRTLDGLGDLEQAWHRPCPARKQDWAGDLQVFRASRGVRVFVDQAAQDRFSADLLCVDVGHGGAGSVRFVVGDVLGDALVRPGRVVVRLVLGQDGAQMSLAEDQDAVEEFSAEGADEAFADRVHARSLDGGEQDPSAGGLKDGVKGADNKFLIHGRGSGTCCDTRSHVVSELVEEVGLMPVT